MTRSAALPTGAIHGSATSLNRQVPSPASTLSSLFFAQSRIAAISWADGLRDWARAGALPAQVVSTRTAAKTLSPRIAHPSGATLSASFSIVLAPGLVQRPIPGIMPPAHHRRLRTPVQNLQIDGQRLWDMLMHTAQFGATAKGGICRLTLTDLDRHVRDWFRAQCEALGCTVAVDEMGTMFALRPGKNQNLAPIAMGSHLDTQPTGGKFDGVLGVLGALEAMRTLHETGYETNAPIEIVNWTNEEGSRFAPAMLASGVFAGVFTLEYAYSRTDREGKTFGEELQRIGYKGPEKAGARKFGAMFELHIEQGPILEDEHRMVGIVQGVQGMRWYEVTVIGQEAHTGATPMRLRKNALLGAARMIEQIDAIALEHSPNAVGAVGLVENKPNSRNVVPGEVFFTIDFRHPEDKVLDIMEGKFRAALAEILE